MISMTDHPGQPNKALGQLFKHQKVLIAGA